MPIKRVATAGTAVALVAAPSAPIDSMCARTTLQWLATNAGDIYVGVPGPGGTGASVSSTAYDAILNASNPSMTIGIGNRHGGAVERHLIYINAGTNADGVAEAPEYV